MCPDICLISLFLPSRSVCYNIGTCQVQVTVRIERLRQKAKIKSRAYIQLGEKVLQTVHQTFEPDIPVIFHLLTLANTTIDTDTVPLLYVIQEASIAYPPLTISLQVSNLNQ